jgi:hypothetical protein
MFKLDNFAIRGKRTVPSAKDGDNKELHHEKILMFSIYLILVLEGCVEQLTEGKDGMTILNYVFISQIWE